MEGMKWEAQSAGEFYGKEVIRRVLVHCVLGWWSHSQYTQCLGESDPL